MASLSSRGFSVFHAGCRDAPSPSCGMPCDVCGRWRRCARTKPVHGNHWCQGCIVQYWDEQDKAKSLYRRWWRNRAQEDHQELDVEPHEGEEEEGSEHADPTL